MVTLSDTQQQLRALGDAAIRLADGQLLDREWLDQRLSSRAPGTPEVPANGPLLTMTEASEHLRISRWSLYQLINRQQIATITIGRRRLVPATEIERFVGSLATTGGAQ